MPIDFSKINLSILPKRGNVVKAPPKKGRIDYGAIKLSNVYTPAKAAPKPTQKISVPAVGGPSTPFIGRPLVTPVEQQRMRAATPKPTLYRPGITPTFNEKGTVVKNPETQKAGLRTGLDYFNRYTETALSTIGALTDTYAGYAWNKDTWSIAKQRIKDSYSQIWSPPALEEAGVPAAVGRAAGNVLSLAGEAIVAWQMGKAVVQTGKQLQTTNRRIWGMEQVDKVLTATDDMKARLSAAGEGATVMPESQSYGALISSVAKASENPSAETMGQMMSDYATAIYKSPVVGPTLRSALPPTSPPITNALARLAGTLADSNTQAGLASFASTLPATINPGMAPIPMPAGLLHSTAPAIPMGGKVPPAIGVVAEETPVATEPYIPHDKFQVEHPLLERPQPAVPGVQTKKSMDQILTEEADMGNKLDVRPRAVDKTIPALDIKKANLVDVTGKVDLKSVQVKFPSADTVYLDPKHRTVAFFHGTTPLEAIAVDKPQLKEWYGIEGAKLLGEITRPVVAQITPTAPTLSKMETPADAKNEIIVNGKRYRPTGIQSSINGKTVGGWEYEYRGTWHEVKGVPQRVKADQIAATSVTTPQISTPAVQPAQDLPEGLRPLVEEARKYRSADEFARAMENPTNLTTSGLFVGQKNLPVGGELVDRVLDKRGGEWYRVNTIEGKIIVIPVEDAKISTGWLNGPADFYDRFVGNTPNSTPDLATTPQKGTATTISNQKTGISTSPPVSLRSGTATVVKAVVPTVKGGKVTFKASNGSELTGDIISVPELYDFTIAAVKSDNGGWHAHELTSGYSLMTDSMGIVKTKKALGELIVRQLDKVKKYGEASPADALLRMVSPTKVVNPEFRRPTAVTPIAEQPKEITTGDVIKEMSLGGFELTMSKMVAAKAATTLTKKTAINGMMLTRKEYVEAQVRSGSTVGLKEGGRALVAPAGDQWMREKDIGSTAIDYALWLISEKANPASVPTALITSTSAPAAAPSLGNATPAHGLIDYSRIELKGTASATAPSTLKTAGNPAYPNGRTNASTNSTGKGFDNYIQNTTGTKETSLSPFAKFKEGRDLQVRRYENEFDGLMKTPAGAEWMTLAIEADEVLREEYARPFSINDAGERVYAEGEFAPAILNRYLKQYGPNFGKFLQHLQRAGISTDPTLGLSAEKEVLKQKHIFDARMSLVNFQKNEPQLFTAYMAAADELGNANALLAEFYKGIISPETYANDKANPHYYVSLSAGKTDIFDRSGVAPLERTHGLTDLDHVVPPLEGLKAVYVDAIRAQGINNAKKEAVRSNKNSEVATTELSDSIVHLKENGVERAYDVHDTNVTQSVHNLTLKKPEVPTWEKHLVKDPTTSLRFFATGLNPAFGLFNIIRDFIQSIFTVPSTLTGLVKGTIRAFKSPQLSQWFDSYRDPMMSKGTKALEALKVVTSIITYPNEIGESLTRSVIAESVVDRGGTYLDQLHAYYASTGFFTLHGTFFNDFIPSCIPFTRATIAVVRAAYRNTFLGLPIGGKGGTFSGKQGAEKLAGRNLATIIFTIISALAIKEAGKEKEYKLLRDRASYFYFPTPSGAWVKLPVPIGFQPIKSVVDSLFGYKSDPLGVAGQTLNVIPGLEAFMLPPALALFLQFKFNINFFTGAAITAAVGTPAANPLEAALMKTGMDEGQAAFLVRAFLADIPSQVQYVFDMVTQGSSTQAFPASKRFIVKDPTTSSNAAVDDFYALVDAAGRSNNPALKHYVNARADAIGKLLHNAKAYPADAKVYITTATDNIIATFATIAENPSDYGIKKFGPFSWRPSGNYEALAP